MGDIELETEEEPIQDAETVKAPFIKLCPLVFECKLYKKEKHPIISHFEAIIHKTYISEVAKDENGVLDLKKLVNFMIWRTSAAKE